MNTERFPKRKIGDKKEDGFCEREQPVSNQYLYMRGSKRVTLYLFFRENSGTKGIECVSFLSGSTWTSREWSSDLESISPPYI